MSSIVISVVLVVVGVALVGMLRTSARLDATARAMDDARAVTAAVTRSLAPATLVNPPTTVGADTYLEALVPGTAGQGAAQCVQWRAGGSSGLVESRSWVAGATTAPAWTTVGRGLTGTQPFAVLPVDDDWSHVRVVVTLSVQRPSGAAVPATAVVALVNGSGAQGGLAADPVCTEVPRS